MKKIAPLMLVMVVLTVSACAPQATVVPTLVSTAVPTGLPTDLPTAIRTVVFTATPTAEPTKELVTPTQVNLKAGQRLYTNDAFKLAIKYPATWFAPTESMDGDKLSISFDSYEPMNVFLGIKKTVLIRNVSYSLSIDYTRNEPEDVFTTNIHYSTMLKLKDGETSFRGMSDENGTTKLRSLHIGRFNGYEAVDFSSDPTRNYRRIIVLFDPQRKDLIEIWASWFVDWDQDWGVDVSDMKKWRAVYERGEKASSPSIDELHEMIESITVE